ncbi:DUF5776 domain-containing protein [Levilactobacillus brevis]|uniref:DUF5776 domain-containing protein n=1 Tax=Levilactobacillus brevis TaxID=1580 RepID=UPI001BAD7714|nr:leucine-rich repeat domain-containing protein [Levilactobacillus brevis]
MKRTIEKILVSSLLIGMAYTISNVNDVMAKSSPNINISKVDDNVTVSFNNAPLNDAVLSNLKSQGIIENSADSFTTADLEKLSELDISTSGLNFDKHDINLMNEYMTNVQTLSMNECSFDSDFNISKFVSSAPDFINGLKTVSLTKSNLTDDELTNKTGEEVSAENLQSLDLSGNKIQNLDFISGYDFPMLQKINFSHNNVTTINSSAAESSNNFKNIENIDFSYNNLSSINGVQNYDFPHLQSVNFGYNKIENVDIASQNTVTFPALTKLDLSNNAITNLDGIGKFKFSELDSINFSSNQLTSFEQLRSYYKNFPKLSIFKGDDNYISDFSPMTIIKKLSTSSSANDQTIKIKTDFVRPSDSDYHIFRVKNPIVPVTYDFGKEAMVDGTNDSVDYMYNDQSIKNTDVGSERPDSEHPVIYDVNTNEFLFYANRDTLTNAKVNFSMSYGAISGSVNFENSWQTPTPTPDKDLTYLKNYGSVKVGSAVYGTKHIYLYKDFIFSKNERLVSYAKKPRVNRPMFVVNKIVKNKNGKVRFYVKDVNQRSSTKGKTGYITANENYVSMAYYQTKQAKVTVINASGINGYKKENLTGKVKTYKQGTVLNVKKIVKYNSTNRYVLSNGQYITANRKLVQTGKQKMVKRVQVKQNIKLYRDVNLSKRTKNKQVIKKGTKLSIKKYDYSQTNVMTKSGTKRYLVKGGYITANSKYVKTIQTK